MAREAFMAVGKRKTAIARVRMVAGTGKITVNKREVRDYFPRPAYVDMVLSPLVVTETADKFDIKANICGGGLTGQAGALRQGIAKALLLVDVEHRKLLKPAGFITRDAREKERRKYGLRKARKRPQYSKR